MVQPCVAVAFNMCKKLLQLLVILQKCNRNFIPDIQIDINQYIKLSCRIYMNLVQTYSWTLATLFMTYASPKN